MIDRDTFFSMVRETPFPGSLTQQQVDGMDAILDFYEETFPWPDLRWLANLLAQTKWETSSTMWPVAEYGHGGDADYAKKDPETGQCYYGRGLLQLTWRANYARADKEMGWLGIDRCEWNADLQLDINWSAPTAFLGMAEGWFRSSGGSPNDLAKYFNAEIDDPYNAREIVNGDKSKVPSWASGASVGELIVADHNNFLKALRTSYREDPVPEPPEPDQMIVRIHIEAPRGVRIIVSQEKY